MHSRLWLLVPLLAALFLALAHGAQIRRVNFVASLDQEAAAGKVLRSLVVPGHSTESYDLIVQTEAMLERGLWRLGAVDYDNAPQGRRVLSPLPMRWYLGSLARLDHAFSEHSLARSVERAAIVAGPVLHLLILFVVTVLVAWQISPGAAAWVSLGVVALFPFAAGFPAAAPTAFALAQVCNLTALLFLLIAFRQMAERTSLPLRRRRVRLWPVLAGMAGGCGLWLEPFSQIVLLMGMSAGALLAGARRNALSDGSRMELSSLWWNWGIAGSATALVAWGIENFPAMPALSEHDRLHPVHALGWVGLAAGLAVVAGRPTGESWRARDSWAIGLALVGLGALSLLLVLAGTPLLPHARADLQLTGVSGTVMAPHLAAWFAEGGAPLWATLLPLFVLVAGLRRVIRGGIHPLRRVAVALGCGAVLASVLVASFYLKWWQQVDVALLAVIAGMAATFEKEPSPRGAMWASFGWSLLLAPGIISLLPSRRSTEIPVPEVNAMLERDLARWLARRAGRPDATVWAPPETTSALHFYGGLRGVGTLAPENIEGLTASMRIARAASAPEAQALLQRRDIAYLVLPSWDAYFDGIVAATGDRTEGTFFHALRAGDIPRWLRPVPYQFRRIAGIEDYRVEVFEVVDEQEEVVALSRRAEHFAEMGQLEAATTAAETLRRFPTDVSALAARAQVCAARNEAAGLARIVADLRKRLETRGDRFLAWDRRVSLAIVLARHNEAARAHEQARLCVEQMNAERLRSLSPGMLLNLQILLRALEIPLPSPELRDLAHELLPFELRRHL